MSNVNTVNANANIDLDKVQFNWSTLNLQLDSSSLQYLNVSNGVMNGSPFYNLTFLHNGSSTTLPCSLEVYEKAAKMQPNQRCSVVVRVDLRQRRNRIVDIG